MSNNYRSVEKLVDDLVRRVGTQLVVGVPIGLGKATHVVDELFRRAQSDSSISLSIFSGLTLETPKARGDLERRFLEPLAERLYGGWPTPLYADALRRGALPANITVREFYLRPGAYLANRQVQQSYTSLNYSQVAAELLRVGVNVIAQLITSRPESPGHYSLGSNPEITLDLLPQMRDGNGQHVAMVGQVNRQLPYMLGGAEIDAAEIDFVLDDPALDFPMFTLPNRQVNAADYATAMHVASLVCDGGTIQIGIGSFSDAFAHCLLLRHTEPALFADVLARLPGGTASTRRPIPARTGRFDRGLFASTELLSDALFALFENGIVCRPAGGGDARVMHVGFFVGSGKLYDALRELPEPQRQLINMTRISEVNTLYGDEHRKRRQRQRAAFVNETMMATLLGAAVSDGLEDGRVVSGVGGQFDFVSMAQQLTDAQSILMVRARRESAGKTTSNIRWSYGHTTVPRHHRDLYVSEYGIAATRGRTDSQIIDAMLGISDAAFQADLLADARSAGKVPVNYRLPADASDNTPQRLHEVFDSAELHPHFPPYPLGTELTTIEQALARALGWLENVTAQPGSKAATIARALLHRGDNHTDALDRMTLDAPLNLRERLAARLVNYALHETKI